MKLNRDTIKKIVESALSARSKEIGCDDCSALLAEFAERTLENRDMPEAMRLVGEHLERCPGCNEEFEALMRALRDTPR